MSNPDDLIERFRLVFAHHPYWEWDRCVCFDLRGRRIVLCARCLGIAFTFLPTILVLLVQGVEVGVLPVTALAIPAIADWTLARYRIWEGTNLTRILTGGFLGIAIGAHVANLIVWPPDGSLLVSGSAIVAVVFVIELTSFRTWYGE